MSKWHEAVHELSRLPDIVSAIARITANVEVRRLEYVAPRTPTEATVAEVWAGVLGLTQVGVGENFFDLGGDSLLMVQAIARVGSALGREVPIAEFIEGATVEQVACRLSQASHVVAAIERRENDGRTPLSSAQQRLWFIDRAEGGGAAYHIPLALRLSGSLNRDALQAALDALVARHEVLRTTFRLVDGAPVQVIAGERRFALDFADLVDYPEAHREAEGLRHACSELNATFDLSVGPLIRGRLLRLSSEEHVLLITMHHVISDGWSLGVLMSELGALYDAELEGRSDSLAPLPIQYADYARWQRQWLADAPVHEQLKYWMKHLGGAPALLELPTDRPRPAVRTYQGASVPVSLETDLAAGVISMSQRFDLTLAMTLHTAWSILLAKLSGHADVLVGVPVANRRRAELEGMIGLFVNTVVVRHRLEDDPTVAEALLRAKHAMWGAYAHQDLPFEQVVDALQPERSLSYNPVFQVMFAFQNVPSRTLQLHDLTVVEQEIPATSAQFDLLLTLQPKAGGICGTLNYASDLFDRSTIERWVGYFKCLLTAMVRQPSLQISRLSIMDDQERWRILNEFTGGRPQASEQTLIHPLFESQAQRSPHAVAVTCEGLSYTYAELNARANRLARYLRNKGVGPDQLVAICFERSLDMIVALVATLKAGGGYLPLDPSYPKERLEYMLRDAGPRLVLTQQRLVQELPTGVVEAIALDGVWESIESLSADNLDPKQIGVRSEHLAYVIYTSGSTGRPKGVMVEHRNVTRLFSATNDWFHFSERDVWTLFHSIAFDFSVWELWGALLYGGRVVVVPSLTARSPRDFYKLLCQERVTVLNQTPSAFTQLIDIQARSVDEHSLRLVIFGGEALDPRKLQPWVQANGADAPELVNMYGITETTVHVTYQLLTADEIASQSGSAIGKPIPDLKVYLLDRHRQPVPIGVAGEIHVCGAGVARGYLNREELTAERFIRDPFAVDPSARMYKSGDLARWRADGTLDYLGRNDHQVKIRGFRIELAEIEAQLLRHEAVKEVAVIARGGASGEKRLVAYLVLHDADTAHDVEMFREHLRQVLPDYMVPSAFVVLPRLPLTSNGKLDRGALPEPTLRAYASRQHEAPRGEFEQALADIWQSVLNIERVGREDSFFRLGGSSLTAMQMQARVQAALEMEIPMRLLFESPTLRELSARIEAMKQRRLLEEIARMGDDARLLLEQVASMRPSEVSERLHELTSEGKL
jgi:amino acid adenylation domain-containing protein